MKQSLKCSSTFRGPKKVSSALLKSIGYRSNNSTEAFNEPPIKVCKANKSLNFLDVGGFPPCSKFGDFVFGHFESILGYNKSEEVDSVFVKNAFRRGRCKAISP